MHAIRVDGNDIFAVKAATSEARRVALEKSCPVLIEAMTYRLGHHSTSDDSTRYRQAAEIKFWFDNFDPITRFRRYMEHQGWWSDQNELALRDTERFEVLKAMETAENKPKPPLDQMFEDVYLYKTEQLINQEKDLLEHIKKYPAYYSPKSNTH